MVKQIGRIDARRSGKTAAMQAFMESADFAVPTETEFAKEYPAEVLDAGPPNRLSLDPNSEDFHPCFVRVGVRIDGVERFDIQWYAVDRCEYMTTAKASFLATTIEPYWRFPESRQQRRARERWEGKRK